MNPDFYTEYRKEAVETFDWTPVQGSIFTIALIALMYGALIAISYPM